MMDTSIWYFVPNQIKEITKQGNRYLRTAFIDANQRAYRTTKLSRELKTRRVNANPEFIAIADRCLK
jgi:hypothetical protein